MHRRAALAVIAGLTFALMSPAHETPAPSSPNIPNYKISGPYTHGNLDLFLIHGADTVVGKKVVTLQEAMEKKIVVVHETSDVNMLSIENNSPDVEVFIMSGDVVKGGKQDRVIAFDIVVPSKSGRVAMPSFCVESGRWRKRGAEADGHFGCSDNQVVGRGLKVAVNASRQQGEVWQEVAEAQKKLSDNLGKNVQAPASASSLQLALEDKDLQGKLAAYEKKLGECCKEKSDVIGLAVVVNGQVSSVDIFGSSELFGKLWPKLLKSAATEAFAESKVEIKYKAPEAAKVEQFMAESAKGEATVVSMARQGVQTSNRAPAQGREPTQTVQPAPGQPAQAKAPAPPEATYRCSIVQVNQPKTLLVESRDNEKAGVVWHRCFIAKDEPKPKPPVQPQERGNQQERGNPPQPKGRGR